MTLIIQWLASTLLQEVNVSGKYSVIEVTSRDGTKYTRQTVVCSDDDFSEVWREFNRRTLAIQDQGYSRRNLDDHSRSFCKYDRASNRNEYVELFIAEALEN
jgi:hypothetical protein